MAKSKDDYPDLNHYDVDDAYNVVFNELAALVEESINVRDNCRYELVYCERIDDEYIWSLRSTPSNQKLNAPGFQEVIPHMYWIPNLDNAGATLRKITGKILNHWRKREAKLKKSSNDSAKSGKKRTRRSTPGIA